jgi:hypothetical protein
VKVSALLEMEKAWDLESPMKASVSPAMVKALELQQMEKAWDWESSLRA